ncbi:unnamed protein product, partial [Ranitomeya imitator]
LSALTGERRPAVKQSTSVTSPLYFTVGAQSVLEAEGEGPADTGNDGNQGKHRVTKRGPALSYPMFTLVTSEDIAESVSHTPIQRCLRGVQRRNKVLDFLPRPATAQQGPDRCCLSHWTISLARTLQRHGSLAISSSVTAQITNTTRLRRSKFRYYPEDKNVICRNCNKRGHLSKSCPEPKKLPACCLCGRRGHLQYDCPDPYCSNCFMPGHIYQDCSERPHWQKKCFRCSMIGHYADLLPTASVNVQIERSAQNCGRRHCRITDQMGFSSGLEIGLAMTGI